MGILLFELGIECTLSLRLGCVMQAKRFNKDHMDSQMDVSKVFCYGIVISSNLPVGLSFVIALDIRVLIVLLLPRCINLSISQRQRQSLLRIILKRIHKIDKLMEPTPTSASTNRLEHIHILSSSFLENTVINELILKLLNLLLKRFPT